MTQISQLPPTDPRFSERKEKKDCLDRAAQIMGIVTLALLGWTVISLFLADQGLICPTYCLYSATALAASCITTIALQKIYLNN